MEAAYKSILYKYFLEDSIFFIIAAVVLIILIVIELIRKKRKKAICIEGALIGISLIAILVVFASVQIDINKNDIVQVSYSQGYIYTQSKHKEFTLATPYYFKTNEGYNVELSVVEGIPDKLEDGTIIYSKHSQVLLDYTARKTDSLR